MMENRIFDLASGWIEMVDDLGPTAFLKLLVEPPDLRARLQRRGVEVIDDPAAAATLIVDESSLVDIDSASRSATIVCLITNRWSPLHWLDRGPRGKLVRLSKVRGRLERSGRTSRSFGVFRSTVRPLALIGLDTPIASHLTVSALGAHVGGWRRRILHAAIRFDRILGSSSFRWLVIAPGWLVITPGEGRGFGLDPTGQVGYAQSTGCTRILGEPPRYIEREAAMATLLAEAAALEELSASSMASLVPTVVRAPDRNVSRPGGRAPSLVTSLLPGHPLRPRQMTDHEIETWTRRAATLLDELQSATLGIDGSVLVHGDYWLGNMLVDDDRIVGIIDWETAHRGSPVQDREFLGRSLTGYLDRDQAFANRIGAIVDRRSCGEAGETRSE